MSALTSHFKCIEDTVNFPFPIYVSLHLLSYILLIKVLIPGNVWVGRVGPDTTDRSGCNSGIVHQYNLNFS